MIDIFMALDQSVSPLTVVRTIQNTGVFWQAVFQSLRLHFTHKRDFYSHEQTRSWVYLKGSLVPT